jgi:hypothetical protein
MTDTVFMTDEESQILKKYLLSYVVDVLKRGGGKDDGEIFPAALDTLLQYFYLVRG